MFQDRIASFFYLKIFVIVVILFIVGSILVRLGSEIIESTFRNNTFSLLYVAPDSKLIFVDKASGSVMYLSIGDIRSFVKGKNAFESSIALGVPINAIIVDSTSPKNISDFLSSTSQLRLLFAGDKPIFKNLDKYDVYKLASVMRGASKDNKLETRVNLFDQKQVKEKIGDGFKDSVINNMGYTIEIDNGTSIDGLGSDLAVILGREGYNILSVRTSNHESNSFVAYQGKSDVFINSLVGLTSFPLKNAKDSSATDITIFLGDDVDAMLSP